MFVGRRCSSQLDIPTLWIKEDDEEEEFSSSRSKTKHRRPSFEVSHQYHSRTKRRFRHYRHSLPISANCTEPPRRTSMFLSPSTPSTVLAASPLTPSETNTILHAEMIMLKPTGSAVMTNEVSDERLPILNPIHCANYQSEKGGSSIVGSILTRLHKRGAKGDRDRDRYYIFTFISVQKALMYRSGGKEIRGFTFSLLF